MALPTLSEILDVLTQQEALDQRVFPELTARGVDVTAWAPGDVLRSTAYLVAKLWNEAQTNIAAFAATFEDWVFGFASPPLGLDVTNWAPLISKQHYGLDRIEATRTRRTLTLTNSIATPHTAAVGTMIVQFTATGNRYVNAAAYVSAGSDTVKVDFDSEFALDSAAGRTYGDASGAAIILVTSRFNGVTVTNPAPTFSPVAQVGTGTGTLTLTAGPAGSLTSYSIRIDTSGASGAATWSYSIAGAAYVSAGAAANVANIGGTGVNVALTNGAGTPSFVAGDVYSFTSPGSDVVTVGRDVETPQELGARCYGLRPLLAAQRNANGNALPISPTLSGYEALTRTASTQAKIVKVATSLTINNVVNITVAGQGATLSPGTIAAMQSYLNSYDMITDRPIVASPSTTPITLAGAVTVTVRAALLTSAQTAMQRLYAAYFQGVDTQALSIGGTVQRDWLVYLIRATPGVTATNADQVLTINGAATDLTLGGAAMADWFTTPQALSSIFSWATV